MTKPACMAPDDYADWLALNSNIYQQSDRATTPCHDCITSFALEMRTLGCCDGIPRGVEEDDGPVIDYHGPLRLNAEKRKAERQSRVVLAASMYADGMTRNEIAAALGVRQSAVGRYLREAA